MLKQGKKVKDEPEVLFFKKQQFKVHLTTPELEQNPYNFGKETSNSINKTIENLKKNKHKFVKESCNRNYRFEFNKSFRFVRSVQAGKNPMIGSFY